MFGDRRNRCVQSFASVSSPSVLNLLEEAVEYISHIPMPGVVFAVDLGVDGLFRAVRDNVMSQVGLRSFK